MVEVTRGLDLGGLGSGYALAKEYGGRWCVEEIGEAPDDRPSAFTNASTLWR